METVKAPYFDLVYAGKNITADAAPFVLSLTFTDQAHGKSDEVSIELEDSQRLWQDAWFPEKGATLTLAIGYKGETPLPCGEFQVDQIEFSGPPDRVSLMAVSAGITKAVRQHNTVAYENKTLGEIAADIARRHGYSVFGTVKPIRFKRITQNQQNDLAFLVRLAGDYGQAVKVVGNKLVFEEIEKLEKSSPGITLGRTDLIRFSLRDKSQETYQASSVDYQDPAEQTVHSHREGAGKSKADTLKIHGRVENKQQAQERAKAALRKNNGREREGQVSLPGNPDLSAGMTVRLEGFGVFSGIWFIDTARHRIDRSSGYTTELEIRVPA